MEFLFCNNLLRDRCLQEYGACFSSLRNFDYDRLWHEYIWVGYRGVVFRIGDSRYLGNALIEDCFMKGKWGKSMDMYFYHHKGACKQQLIRNILEKLESYKSAYN